MLIVQHMPPDLPEFFPASRQISKLQVVEAEDSMRIAPGKCFIAPGDKRLLVRRQGAKPSRSDDVLVGLQPAVNVLFDSIAKSAQAMPSA